MGPFGSSTCKPMQMWSTRNLDALRRDKPANSAEGGLASNLEMKMVVAVGCKQLCRSQRFYQSSLVCKCFDKSLIRDSCKQNMQRLQTHRSRFLVTSVSEPKFKLTNGR